MIREEKQTTKLRIVYDASAKFTGSSLNDCLCRTCIWPKHNGHFVAVPPTEGSISCRLEKTFLMITVDEEDRDVLRFLWIEDMECKTP